MKELTEEVYSDLSKEFKEKFKFSDELFKRFFEEYILNAIQDSDLLKEINKKNRNISDITTLDYLQNDRILLRAIKLLVLFELSKDFKEFQKLNKKIKKDKDFDINIEFDKVLNSIIKVSKEV